MLSASVPRLKFILVCSEHMALPEVAYSDRESIKEVVFRVRRALLKVYEYIVTFYVVVGYMVRVNCFETL